jgi:Protein of unknown function (DUF2752)
VVIVVTVATSPQLDPTPRRPVDALRAPLSVAAAALAATTYLALVDPNQPGHYPICPFRSITGYACPGCGSLRAVHDLATGNLAGALQRNVLTVLALPLLALLWVRWLRTNVSGPRAAILPPWLLRSALWSMLALVVAFGVTRNLPGLGRLGP